MIEYSGVYNPLRLQGFHGNTDFISIHLIYHTAQRTSVGWWFHAF
ncbi:hypothetical protein [Chryseobacterium arthrosphaerae]